MKIKSIVLTAALATAFSAFSDSASVDVDWFTTNAISVVKFDRNINDPVVVTNSVAAPAGFTVAAYAVTAYVTNLVVFAEKPAATNLTAGATKGAICAAYDSTSSTNKWYGLYKNNSSEADWAKLENLTDPAENSSYALKMEFKSDGVAKVKYSVGGVSSEWLNSPGTYEQPNFYAFAGMGYCTNIVGEIVVAATDTDVAVTLSDGSKVLLPAETTVGTAEAKQANDLKMWVNYVLGIDGKNAEAKPYAAPVQNASSDALTFSLGGVNVGAHVTGAKVSYTVEQCNSPTGEWSTAFGDKYKASGESIDVETPKSGVKYYRVKIKIDPAH